MPVPESPMKLNSISSRLFGAFHVSAMLWQEIETIGGKKMHDATANLEWQWHWPGRCFFVLYITWRAMWWCWWCCSQSLPAPRAHDESLQVCLQLPAGHLWISSNPKTSKDHQETWCQDAAYATRHQWSTNPQHVSTPTNSVYCVGSSTFSTTELKLTRWHFSSGAAACASNSVPGSFARGVSRNIKLDNVYKCIINVWMYLQPGSCWNPESNASYVQKTFLWSCYEHPSVQRSRRPPASWLQTWVLMWLMWYCCQSSTSPRALHLLPNLRCSNGVLRVFSRLLGQKSLGSEGLSRVPAQGPFEPRALEPRHSSDTLRHKWGVP